MSQPTTNVHRLPTAPASARPSTTSRARRLASWWDRAIVTDPRTIDIVGAALDAGLAAAAIAFPAQSRLGQAAVDLGMALFDKVTGTRRYDCHLAAPAGWKAAR